MNLLDKLPEFSFDLLDIIPEKVLLKMNIDDCITLNGKIIKLIKLSKYSGKQPLVEYTAVFDVYGKVKKVYVLYHGGRWMIVGYLGKGRDWLDQVLRDIEGQIVCDKINENNPFHELSDVYEIYMR